MMIMMCGKNKIKEYYIAYKKNYVQCVSHDHHMLIHQDEISSASFLNIQEMNFCKFLNFTRP